MFHSQNIKQPPPVLLFHSEGAYLVFMKAGGKIQMNAHDEKIFVIYNTAHLSSAHIGAVLDLFSGRWPVYTGSPMLGKPPAKPPLWAVNNRHSRFIR